MHYCSTHKFGGTSLADATCFRQAISVLPKTPVCVVVSAVAGVTDALDHMLNQAMLGEAVDEPCGLLREQHRLLASDLVSSATQVDLFQLWDDWFVQVKAILTSVSLVKTASYAERAQVLGLGERLSASLFSQASLQKRQSTWLNSHDFLLTVERGGRREILWDQSQRALTQLLDGAQTDLLVVTGFLAADESGCPCLLQRNGSDYSAAVLAELLKVDSLTIWSDQAGIFSADPRWVPSAFALPDLSYHEALELAYFGAAIIHPKTIVPCMQSNRSIYIKNTAFPEKPGSHISEKKSNLGLPVRGISSLSNISVVTIEGAGMMGVSGISAKAFASLEEANVSVIMISQASSEHSICLCVQSVDVDKADAALALAFDYELTRGDVSSIHSEGHMAIVAAVGDGMVGELGIAGRFCQTLAQAQVNIRVIAQGASERNISVVVSEVDVRRAVRALHAGFYLSSKTLAIGIIGVGVIGSELLDQIIESKQSLFDNEGVTLLPTVIANSRQLCKLSDERGFSHWREALSESKTPFSIADFIDVLAENDAPHRVVIDCTANQSVADSYVALMNNNCHVITPNKRAGSGDYDYYQKIRQTCQHKKTEFLYEATVCAGLPVIHTLQDLLRTGDEINRVSGVVSGSLSYIFNRLRAGARLSEAVLEAKNAGYTEPDPRDDLSGTDVVRKMVCLAREMGFATLLSDVSCENLVPADLIDVSLDDFLARLPDYDGQFESDLMARAKGKTGVWTFMGAIDNAGCVEVSLQLLPPEHPFSNLNATDNMMVFETKRYHDQPLVIQGPGAGAAVTAGGVFADLLRLSAIL